MGKTSIDVETHVLEREGKKAREKERDKEGVSEALQQNEMRGNVCFMSVLWNKNSGQSCFH